MESAQELMIDEWIKKMSYIHMMEYYSAIKKNGTGDYHVEQDKQSSERQIS
jgi:hypothetical protein